MKKPIYKRKWFIVVVIILVLGVFGAAMGDNDTKNSESKKTTTEKDTAIDNKDNIEDNTEEDKTEEPEPEVIVVAKDLAQEYDDNEIKANKNYKDKFAEITGKVSSIGEVLSSTYVVLSAEKDFALTQVQCFFKDKSEIDKIAEISKGDTVTIIGTIDGKSLNVEVENCKFKD